LNRDNVEPGTENAGQRSGKLEKAKERARISEIGGRKSEVGGPKTEDRGQRTEVLFFIIRIPIPENDSRPFASFAIYLSKHWKTQNYSVLNYSDFISPPPVRPLRAAGLQKSPIILPSIILPFF
jgi:hypothetical protein